MIKRYVILITILLLIPAVSGCFNSGSNDAQVQNEISLALSGFRSAVENYKVDGMLAPLANTADFKLWISESGIRYPKDYATLQSELVADETNQKNWRLLPPGGEDYKLELILGQLSFHNLSDTGGVADQTFAVWESAHDIPRTNTDTGTIIWHAAKMGGIWKVVEMEISFDSGSSSSIGISGSMNASAGGSPSRFGFGNFPW